jgi:hypothetical protein
MAAMSLTRNEPPLAPYIADPAFTDEAPELADQVVRHPDEPAIYRWATCPYLNAGSVIASGSSG